MTEIFSQRTPTGDDIFEHVTVEALLGDFMEGAPARMIWVASEKMQLWACGSAAQRIMATPVSWSDLVVPDFALTGWGVQRTSGHAETEDSALREAFAKDNALVEGIGRRDLAREPAGLLQLARRAEESPAEDAETRRKRLAASLSEFTD
jgi:hypothetical protein